ncbi:MAG: putative Ig domain-containing protein, partial [Verrucomicrobia bacterium]|nr:putative Ig domain-containing protein [Verrucomicrobiota bacterium]
AAQWDSVNASFASTNGFGQWGLDATASRGTARRVLGYFRGGFINSSNLYDWGNDRRRVVVLNMVRDSASHEYREIIINQNAYSSGNNTAARAAIDAIQPESTAVPAAITTSPAATSIVSGQSTTLTVTASGDGPLTYAWFRGASGTTTNPVGSNSDSFTTPVLTATTSYWVRVTNAANPTGANSATATVTLLQAAAITTGPSSTMVNYGQTTTLSVVASGDGALSYQWYEGAHGVTSKPVGTNASSFTTPLITATKSYWVKVSNLANPSGADSAAATVSVLMVTSSFARILNQSNDLFSISARGAEGSTFFGWDTFNAPEVRTLPIQDSTPDLGTTVVGANFQTTNAEDHVIENGNFFFTTGSLAEQITVPTNGTVGTAGFTSIILQIAAIPGSGTLPGVITLNSIGGVSPKVVQALNSAGDGQLWAQWQLPGNQASYVITMTAAENQAGFGFDKVVVDTFFSDTEFLPDSAAATAPVITTASALSPRLLGVAFSQQLEAAGGTAPYEYVVSAGNLPPGVTLSPAGLISGNATTAVASAFTVQLRDANTLLSTKAFTLAVTTEPVISTDTSLVPGSVNGSYSVTLAASGGTAPYTWTLDSGSLPAGLTLSEVGVLSGIPTTVATSGFTVRLEDSHGFSVTKALSVRVSDLGIATTGLLTAVRNVNFNQSLIGLGGTAPYTWSLSAGTLPVGLSLSSAGGLSGIPSLTASNSTFTVRLMDSTSFSVTRQLTLPVSAVFSAPILQPIIFPALTIGADFNYSVTALNYPRTYVITGLPSGLSSSPTTGVISGRPLVSGLYNVQVRAINVGGASPAVGAQLIVRPLDKNLIGTFGGLVTRNANNGGLGGSVRVTTTSVGSYTVNLVGAFANSKATGAATAYTAKGNLAAAPPQISVSIGGQTLALTLNASTGKMEGNIGAASVAGWRSAWNALTNPAETQVGYYSMAMDLKYEADRRVAVIPQGSGFATLSVSLAGGLTTVGRTADGETITSASFLSENGVYFVYAPLYRNAGSIQGELKLTEDSAGLFADNSISGELTWFKKAIAGSRAYPATFGPINLKADGGYLAPASRGSIILGLPDPGNVSMRFTDGGLASSATEPDFSFIFTDNHKITLPAPSVNPGKVTVTLNPATGVISGTMTLTEVTPPLVRSRIAFQGQVVRLRNSTRKAAGYFLLPQIQATGVAPSILSGGISLE